MGTKRRNPSSRGVPQNLKVLAKSGQRIRFNGFWLNDSAHDRMIAGWLDDTPAAGAVIKELIYRYITRSYNEPEIQPVQDEFAEEIELGDVSKALLGLDD